MGRKKDGTRKETALAYSKSHWQSREHCLGTPSLSFPGHEGGTCPHPSGSPVLALQTCLFWPRTPSPLWPTRPSLDLHGQAWARILSLEVLPLSPLKIILPSCPKWFATDPRFDPTPTTKENRDDLPRLAELSQPLTCSLLLTTHFSVSRISWKCSILHY